MPSYFFEGMDASGSEVKDRIEAVNQADAQRQLRERGYFVTRLREDKEIPVERQAHVKQRKVVPQVDSPRPAVDRSWASPVAGSVASSDPAQHLSKCGWIIEPTDSNGVRMKTRPMLRWVMSGCLLVMLVPVALFFAWFVYPNVKGMWSAGSKDWFMDLVMRLITLAIAGVSGLVVLGLVLQMLWLLFVREEWEVSHDSLAIQRRLLGFSWDREYRDAELILDPHYQKNRPEPHWQLAVKSDGQKHFLIKEGAISSLGGAVFFSQRAEVDAIAALLAQHTGWNTISASAEATQDAHSAAPLLELPDELTKRGFRSEVDEQFRLIVRLPKGTQFVAGLILAAFGGGALWVLSGGLASYVQYTRTHPDTIGGSLFVWVGMTLMLMFFLGFVLLGMACIFGRTWWIIGRNQLIQRSRLFGWTTERQYVDSTLTVARIVRTRSTTKLNDDLRYWWELQIQNQAGKVLTSQRDSDDDVPRLLGALVSEHTGWPLRDSS